MAEAPADPLTVWYDGACPLYAQEIALMRGLDRAGAVRFVDVAASDAGACPLDRTDLLARFHASEDGHLQSGAAAFAALWRRIPALRLLGLAARSPRVLGLLERAYVLFLCVRPRLARFVIRMETPT